MTALAKGRPDLDNAGALVQTLGRPAATGKTFYNNALACLFAGYLRPVTGVFGERVVGVVDVGLADNFVTTGADGDFKVVTKTGIFPFLIGSAGDALTAADVGSRVFAIDDQTVGKTDGGVQRPVAGQLVFVESSRAYVAIGFETPDGSALQAAGLDGSAPDAASVTASVSLLPKTLWSISGTTALTLPNGTFLGQRKAITVIASVSTPNGSIVVTTPRGFATITAISGVGSFFEFEWSATGWFLRASRGGTIA